MDVKAIDNKVLGILNLKVCEDKKDTSKEDTICCENCKKVKELEAEIKELEADVKDLVKHITWLENKAFEYENEAYRLRKQLMSTAANFQEA